MIFNRNSIYQAYNISSEINQDHLERALTRIYYPTRANFLRIKPKPINFEKPPLTSVYIIENL